LGIAGEESLSHKKSSRIYDRALVSIRKMMFCCQFVRRSCINLQQK
jgi:hypothetical protein